jgi:outer membrane protein
MYCNFILRIFFFVLIFSMCMLEAMAQKAWSLQECVDYALKNNLAVKRGEVSAELADVNFQQSKFARLPTLNASAGRNWNFGRTIDPFTNQFTTSQVESDNLSLNSSLVLFNGFQLRNTLQQSRLEFMAGQHDLQKIKNDISLNVVSAYLQALYAKEQLKVAEGRVELAKQQQERVRRMVDNGIMVQGNLLDATAQYATEELALVSAQNQVDMARLALAQLLQLTTVGDFDVLDPQVGIPDKAAVDRTVEEIYLLSLRFLPEVHAADTRMQSAEKGVVIAQGAFAPRLTLFGQLSTFYASSNKRITDGSLIGYAPDGSFISTGFDTLPVLSPLFDYNLETNPYRTQLDQNLNRAVGVSMSIPLFNGLNTRSALQRARLNLESAKINKDQTRNQVFQSIQQAHTDAKAAGKRYEATKGSVEAFEAAFQYAQKRFDAGVIQSLEYLTAVNNLTRSRIDLLQAKYDYIFRLKVLDFYAGIPLTF